MRLQVFGRGVPTNSQAGFTPGCLYHDVTNGFLYWNGGSVTSSLWYQVAPSSSANSNLISNATGSLAVTGALDELTVTLNAAAGQAVTLPAATGTGLNVKFVIGTTITSNTTTITAAGADVYTGTIVHNNISTNAATGWSSTANQIITMNGSTQGGKAGDWIELIDLAAGVWYVTGITSGAGGATPFS